MSSVVLHSGGLPWSDDQSEGLFNKILCGLFIFALLLGIIIPNVSLPELERDKLEKLPPQLANVIKRKKQKKMPPVIKLEKKEKQIIKDKPVVKKTEIPIAKPQVAEPAKPKIKPKALKESHLSKKVKAAKEKAKALVSDFSNELSDMQSLVDMTSLDIESAALSNRGSKATVVGSVVDQTAVDRIKGVDDAQLTRDTGGDQLKDIDRDMTQVAALEHEVIGYKTESRIAGMERTQMQIRRVFEQNKSSFDRIYRKALRNNPLLEGTVTLGVKLAASGDVSDCYVKSSDFHDQKVLKRITLTCKRLVFDQAKQQDSFEYPLTFAP